MRVLSSGSLFGDSLPVGGEQGKDPREPQEGHPAEEGAGPPGERIPENEVPAHGVGRRGIGLAARGHAQHEAQDEDRRG